MFTEVSGTGKACVTLNIHWLCSARVSFFYFTVSQFHRSWQLCWLEPRPQHNNSTFELVMIKTMVNLNRKPKLH
jgi:hypothetical protein